MKRLAEKGGVSIFIVLFTSLMVAVVTTSFAQIMLKTQQQASNSDLSQSAYDAAMAGVEDAKRVLVRLRDCENTDGCVPDPIKNKLETQECQSLDGLGVKYDANGEVRVGAAALNQAYTCVKVELDTESYTDEMPASTPVVIPLKAEGDFDTIVLSWFSSGDFLKIKKDPAVTNTVPTYLGPGQGLPDTDNWGAVTPAVMRTQLIQFTKGNIDINRFSASGTNNARSVFLYPKLAVGPPATYSFTSSDARRSPTTSRNAPLDSTCNLTFDYGGYACQVVLTLPDPDGGTKGNREAYLQLQSYYQNVTSYKVALYNGPAFASPPVKFDGVQPKVDATGRASDMFRRVEANVSLRDEPMPFSWPDAALTVEGNLCKQFFVTNRIEEFQIAPTETTDGPDCDPAN